MAGFFRPHEENESGPEGFISPNMLDVQIRQAIQYCWLSLPKARKTPEVLEREVRMVVDRALRDFKDDYHRQLGGE